MEVNGHASEHARHRCTIETGHRLAFQLLRFQSSDGESVLVWNSRDGEVPNRFSYEGKSYDFRSAHVTRSAVLPSRADLVITTYTREAWLAWAKASWKHQKERDAYFAGRHKLLDSFLRAAPFEHGLARVISREEWLLETPEWQGGVEHE